MQLADGDDESETGIDDVALRRAASLEALQAYGGCFASGFLAMQNPLPWASRRTGGRREALYETIEEPEAWRLALTLECIETGSIATASTNSFASSGSPRPDSDTLSHVDVAELGVKRKWSWRSLGRKKNTAGKLQSQQRLL